MILAEQLLRLFCEKITKQYIIIDGLDECDPAQRKLVLSLFTTIVDWCDERDPGKLRVLLVSQNYPDIEKALQTAAVLQLTPEDNKKDIRAYVRAWCAKIQQRYDLENGIVDDIEESTCVRSKGMFLFAKLVMENLYAQETQMNLLQEIKVYGFPKGLEEAYERILRRMKRSLSSEQWKIACKLLGWMVCAKRPLKWREIQAAVSLNADEQSLDFEERKLRSDIQDYCGSLILIMPGERVELVHTTAKMHVIKTGYVHVSTVECNLAALCLRYLTFECFIDDISQEDLQDSITEGILSFQDYVVAKWLEHTRAIVKITPDVSVADADYHAALQEIEIALDEFGSRYEDDIPLSSSNTIALKDCEPFEKYQFHANLLRVWNHIHSHYEKGSESRNDMSIDALRKVFFRNRERLEELSPQETKDLATFYGEKRFKCPRTTCFYFHEGFKNAKSRDQHINRHDRPFSCVFPDCSIAEFGFASNKDLEKHKRLFHPEIGDQVTSFAAATKPSASTPWECNLCGKRFTRGFHQRNHLRSHTGERPFACSECGKAFTRSNDCRRHEKIHTRR